MVLLDAAIAIKELPVTTKQKVIHIKRYIYGARKMLSCIQVRCGKCCKKWNGHVHFSYTSAEHFQC